MHFELACVGSWMYYLCVLATLPQSTKYEGSYNPKQDEQKVPMLAAVLFSVKLWFIITYVCLCNHK